MFDDLFKLAGNNPSLLKYARKVKAEVQKVAKGKSLTDIGAGKSIFTIKPHLSRIMDDLFREYDVKPYLAQAKTGQKSKFVIRATVNNSDKFDEKIAEFIAKRTEQLLNSVGYRVEVEQDYIPSMGEVIFLLIQN